MERQLITRGGEREEACQIKMQLQLVSKDTTSTLTSVSVNTHT